ncbi:MAG: TonB-dependent receptor [Flavobacterium sp.]|nr:TonB-dependent receptor [Pedobacter sp.]
MKILVKLFILFIATAITWSFSYQDDPLEKLLKQIEKYRIEHPQEKVHLQLDKPYYAIGDNIWFKAYIVNAEDHRLSALSEILYVDLINEKDSIKQSLRLKVKNGLTWGDFTLGDSLKEGNYRIRAYTNWMRNFGEEYFFDKTISIGNSISNNVITDTKYTFSKEGSNQKVEALITYSTLNGEPLINKEVSYQIELNSRNLSKGKGITDSKGRLLINFTNNQPFILKFGKIISSIKLDEKLTANKSIPIKSTSNDVDLQFFPESGNLVNGISSKVGFKAVAADGLGFSVSGIISDQNNNQIAEIKSEHAGMGQFRIQPQEAHTYTATLKFADGSERTFNLPKALKEGYVINADNLDTANLKVRIMVSPGLQQDGELRLVAQSNGVVYYASKSPVDKTLYNASIPKNRFPAGIIQLTLFSPENNPVAERLVFISHPDELLISVLSEKLQSKIREKSKLALTAKNIAGKPVNGSFSVSVIDESKVKYDELDQITILSNLLLSSDIKGYVEQPNYYFVNTNEKVQQLDNLMITQGWRRFTWKNMITNTAPPISFSPEENIQISGTVTSNNGKPVFGGKVTLFTSSGNLFLKDTLTDIEGRFLFSDLNFNDSTRFVIQARNLKDRKNVRIDLDLNPAQIVTKNKNYPDFEINVNSSLITYLQNSRKQYDEFKRFGLINSSILLAEVKITEVKPLVKYSSNLNGAGQADKVITAKELEYATDLITFLQGRVAGLIIRNGIAYSTRNMVSSFSGPIPMQIILDGTYVDPMFLGSLNVKDIETVEVLKSISNTAIYGIRGGGGILIITTKRGENNMGFRNYASGIISFKPQGLYESREFYSPNYDDPKVNTKIADLRTTIYWQPNVITSLSGKATVEYFNSDAKGTYAVIIEGIGSNGEIGRSVYRYEVN